MDHTITDDIDEDVAVRYRATYTRWIRDIDFDTALSIHTEPFETTFNPVANIILDNELRPDGTARRRTTIRFDPIISSAVWRASANWIYNFAIDGNIVKIGGTRTSLASRAGSYLCGHCVSERLMADGTPYPTKCSVTNAFLYHTFEYNLLLGRTIQMFGYMCPESPLTLHILDEDVVVNPQIYHAYESVFMRKYAELAGSNPCLSPNSDPTY